MLHRVSHRFLVTTVLVCLTALSLLFAFWGDLAGGAEDASPDRQDPVKVLALTLSPERALLVEDLSGRVAAYRRVEIRPQVSGIIKKRFVDGGAQVRAGDILFEIDPALLLADLETARAGLARAEGALEHARQGLERAKALFASNATSRKNYEGARNERTTALANSAEARAVFHRRQLDLEFATIRSPINGYAGRAVADEGSLASTSGQTELAVIQDLDRVYIDLRLPAARLDRLYSATEPDLRAELGPVEILDAAGKPHIRSGTLVLSDVTVDAGTGNTTVRLEVDNPDLRLLPGMYVRARVPYRVLPEALLVPEEAVIRNGTDQAQVVVVTESGRTERREVTLGEAIGKRFVVRSGLKAGEEIVLRGQDRLQDGMNVVTVSASQEAAPLAPATP